MGSYHQSLYQIVFATKYREPLLTKENRNYLFDYISGIFLKRKCLIFEINGVEDHLHILSTLHPSISLADLIKETKNGSNFFIKENKLFNGFSNWQEGYGAFTYNQSAKNNLIKYIQNQEMHHKRENSYNELLRMLKEHQIDFDLKYFE